VSEYNKNLDGNFQNSRWESDATNYVDFNGVGAPLTSATMVINSAGQAWSTTQLDVGMTSQTAPGDALKVAVGGSYEGLITSCGALYGRDLNNSTGWTLMNGCGDNRDVAVGSKGYYVIINGCGAAWSRSGVGSGGWTQLTSCGDTAAISAGGQNIALINGGGTAYAATAWWGPLTQVSNTGDAKAIAITSTGRLMMITACGAAYTNGAIGMGGWSQKAVCGDALKIAAGGENVVLINSSGTAYAGPWNGGLAQISNSGDAKEISIGDRGPVVMTTSCGSAVSKFGLSGTSGWAMLTGCGDTLAITG